MNVAVKHATLRCYGPGRALILLLIMPFGVVDSQRPYSDSAPRQAAKTVDVIISPNNPRSRHALILFFLVEPVPNMSVYTVGCQLITTNIHLVFCGNF